MHYLFRVFGFFGMRQPFDVAVQMVEFPRWGWKGLVWAFSWLLGLMVGITCASYMDGVECVIGFIVAYLISSIYDEHMWLLKKKPFLREEFYTFWNGITIALVFAAGLTLSSDLHKLLVYEAVVLGVVIAFRLLYPSMVKPSGR